MPGSARIKNFMEEENHWERFYQSTSREKKKNKERFGPKGGTKASQLRRTKISRFYRGSSFIPKIKIIDKTNK